MSAKRRTKGRRGRNEGTISLRADGRWQVRIPLGRDEQNGKRKRKTAYAATQAEAVEKLKRLSGKAVDGELSVTSTPMIGRFLDDWHARNLDGWKPSTAHSYRDAIDLHLKPAFGSLRLEQLTPTKVQNWMTAQAEQYGARRRIALARATLRSALSEAVRLDLVSRNVAASRLKVPKAKTRTIRPFDITEAGRFVEAAHQHRLGALFSTALACGLRIGEATGVAWSHLNLDTGEVQVRQQVQAVRVARTQPSKRGRLKRELILQGLKTAKSRRTLVLPQVCIDALREHRRKQLEERMKAGDKWKNVHDLVFVTRRGTPLDPRNVLRILHTLLAGASLDRRRFHDLRHSAASILIAQGVPLEQVSMLLGHAELRTTSDIYGHLVKQTAAKAASHMDAVLKPASKG
jgi:integrase